MPERMYQYLLAKVDYMDAAAANREIERVRRLVGKACQDTGIAAGVFEDGLDVGCGSAPLMWLCTTPNRQLYEAFKSAAAAEVAAPPPDCL